MKINKGNIWEMFWPVPVCNSAARPGLDDISTRKHGQWRPAAAAANYSDHITPQEGVHQPAAAAQAGINSYFHPSHLRTLFIKALKNHPLETF